MARVVVQLFESSLRPTMTAALFYRRSYASKSTETTTAKGPSKIKKTKAVETTVAQESSKVKKTKMTETTKDKDTSKIKKTKLITKKPLTAVQKLYLENKLLFGKLVENSKEKRKNLKLLSDSPLTPTVDNINQEDLSTEWEFKQAMKSHPERVRKLERYENPMNMKVNSMEVPDTSQEYDRNKTTLHIESTVAPISIAYPILADRKLKLPSVTRILGDTMPPEQKAMLEKWEKKMRETLGDEGFRLHKEGILNNGRDLHANIREILSGTPEDHLFIPESTEGHWRSVRNVLGSIKQVHALESHVAHAALGYCGIVDCIAMFRDRLVLVDWKTSEKPKPVVTMTYDTPLQIAAYIGAVNEDPNYSIKIREGLIVVAYKNGKNCETFLMTEGDVALAWNKWIKRLNQYQKVQKPPLAEQQLGDTL